MMDEKTIKEKLDYFTGKATELHIIKKNKEWYNCFIISKESDGIYIVNERKFGRRTLFASEVYDLDECKGGRGGTAKST
jgi:hypothetical protein